MRCPRRLPVVCQSFVVAVLLVMPGQTTDDKFTIEEHVRQVHQRIVNRQVAVRNRPVVFVLAMRHQSDHLTTDGTADKLGCVVAERLAAFRCVDAVEA